MKAPTPSFYYSRIPTEDAPCASLTGPFSSREEAEADLRLIAQGAARFLGAHQLENHTYQILRHVAEVQPRVRVNVSLKPIA